MTYIHCKKTHSRTRSQLVTSYVACYPQEGAIPLGHTKCGGITLTEWDRKRHAKGLTRLVNTQIGGKRCRRRIQ